MNKLYLIDTNGAVDEITAERFQLKYSCPRFEDMKQILNTALARIRQPHPVEILKHVNVLFQGKRCHMFVDENGIAMGRFINAKATWIYWNAVHSQHRRTRDLIFTDLTLDASSLLRGMGHYIVGPVMLWTGEME